MLTGEISFQNTDKEREPRGGYIFSPKSVGFPLKTRQPKKARLYVCLACRADIEIENTAHILQ